MATAFQAPSGAPRRWVVAAIVAPSLLAWALLWWAGASPSRRWFEHDHLAGGATAVPLVLLGWVVMTAAMMLPTTAPLVGTFRTVVGARPHHRRLIGLLIAGYIVVWTLVGCFAIVADAVLHAVLPSPAEGERPWVMVVVLVLAGTYQFTPLKRKCLTSCRSPFLFVSQHWRGASASWESFQMGVSHGWFCVGCCWTLMVVMFAVGMGSLGWMLLLAALMAVEKNVARAAFLSPVLGVALFGAASWLAAGG